MDAVVAHKAAVAAGRRAAALADALPARRERRVRAVPIRPDETAPEDLPARSDVAIDNQIPTPPFWGDRVVKGVAARRLLGLPRRAGALPRPVGPEAHPRRRRRLVRGAGRDRGPPAAADVARPDQDREPARGGRRRTATSRASSEGDDLVVLADPDDVDGAERCRFTFPRQRRDRHLCLSDFFRPRTSGRGRRRRVHRRHDGRRACPRRRPSCSPRTPTATTSSCTGCRSSSPRRSPSTGTRGSATSSGSPPRTTRRWTRCFRQGYRGSRYSFGYPACPDLEDQTKLLELLHPDRIGVELSEEFQLHPEQSTSAIIVHHPEAKYFNAS